MQAERKLLAWSKHPEPKGTLYYQEEMSDRQVVIDLFSFCQVSLGYINSDGWELLFTNYGMKGLLDLKISSGWLNSAQKESPFADLVYQSFLSGYNPLDQEKGDYDETIEVFLSLEGLKRPINWVEIEGMIDLG